jgi:hypothetical protein
VVADHQRRRPRARFRRSRSRRHTICSALTLRGWSENTGTLAPYDENVTVLKGTFLAGMGEKFDESKLLTMNAGNFILMPKEMRHFAMCKGETIVQVHGVGPFKVNWVNPADVVPPDAPAAAAAIPKS